MNSNVVQVEFNQKAELYETNRLAQWYKAHAQEITKHSSNIQVGDILDIGCATGYQLRLLADRHPDSTLVGLDIAPKMIEKATLNCSDSNQSQHFICDDWENLNQQSKERLEKFTFKLIICANTFHYFLSPQTAIRQMFELLDTGGMLLVLEREKSNSFLTSFWGFVHRYLIKDQVEFYCADDIIKQMNHCGFSHVNVVTKIQKYFWKGKLFTSIALIKGEK